MRRSFSFAFAFAFALLATGAGACLACHAFDEEPAPTVLPESDAGDASALPPPPDAASPDAGDARAAGDAGLECVPAAAPSCDPATCVKRQLYAQNGGYPFDIVTDDSYVYWIEQRAPGDPYNGTGVARVLRADRAGAADGSRAAVLATALPSAKSLVLDGADLYVSTFEGPDGGAFTPRLRRVTRCMTPPCAAQEVLLSQPLAGVRLVRLYRAAPGVLLARSDNGVLYRIVITPGGATITPLDSASIYTGSTMTDRAAYLTGSESPSVHRISLDGVQVEPAFAPIPPLADAGTGLIAAATDCTNLYGTRTTNGRGDMVMSVSLATKAVHVTAGGTGFGVFDLAADARWIYAASPNAGGLVVVDPTLGSVRNVAPGNVWAVAVDDRGVYFGQHDGTGQISMLVK